MSPEIEQQKRQSLLISKTENTVRIQRFRVAFNEKKVVRDTLPERLWGLFKIL